MSVLFLVLLFSYEITSHLLLHRRNTNLWSCGFYLELSSANAVFIGMNLLTFRLNYRVLWSIRECVNYSPCNGAAKHVKKKVFVDKSWSRNLKKWFKILSARQGALLRKKNENWEFRSAAPFEWSSNSYFRAFRPRFGSNSASDLNKNQFLFRSNERSVFSRKNNQSVRFCGEKCVGEMCDTLTASNVDEIDYYLLFDLDTSTTSQHWIRIYTAQNVLT